MELIQIMMISYAVIRHHLPSLVVRQALSRVLSSLPCRLKTASPLYTENNIESTK